MSHTFPNLRKAAVLIRSLDPDTAAALLAQLSPEEAKAIRMAIRELGPIDADERADVLAEFRRAQPMAAETATGGVALELSAAAQRDNERQPPDDAGRSGKRFEFLENARIDSLVTFLSRERVQTIAVVLSYLAPARAAAVLAALPGGLQAEVVERLSALGEMDPDSLSVLERELSAWMSRRPSVRGSQRNQSETVAAILAAADGPTREGILSNLKMHGRSLGRQASGISAPREPDKRELSDVVKTPAEITPDSKFKNEQVDVNSNFDRPALRPMAPRAEVRPAIHFEFEDLLFVSATELAAVMREVDAKVLTLALAGSSDELVDRIAGQLPRRAAKAFRQQLRRLGPTRLSDVEAAQRAVAEVAARRQSGRSRRAVAAMR